MRTQIPAAMLLCLATACGSGDSNASNNTTGTHDVRTSESNNRSPNNGASNATTNNGSPNNGASNTATNNGSSNNVAGSNNTTGNNNGSGAVTEVEPNDDRDNANMVLAGDTVSGTAEAGGEDVFVLTGSAGTILELEILSADPTLDVSLFVEGASSDVPDRVIDLTAASKRQFFLPDNDAWYISMRSFDVEDRSYEFVVREVTPMPMMNAFSGTVVGNLNDRAVDVYELPDADGEVLASLEAERLATGSELDSVMYVYSPTEGLVTFNDDAMTTTDSELDFDAVAAETYWLVVDAWRLGSDNPYELTVTLPL